MPPLPPYIPFPTAMRIGTDICQITRIVGILRSSRAHRFVSKILREEEIWEMGQPSLRMVIARRHNASKMKRKNYELWKAATRSNDWKDSYEYPASRFQTKLWKAKPKIDLVNSDEIADMSQKMDQDDETRAHKVELKRSVEKLDQEIQSADQALQVAARWLAGRFAAKEATIKAYASRRLTYHSILILKPPRKPGVKGSVAPIAIVLDEEEPKLRAEEQENKKIDRQAEKEKPKEEEIEEGKKKEDEMDKHTQKRNKEGEEKMLTKDEQLKVWMEELEARERRERIDRARGQRVIRLGKFRNEGDAHWQVDGFVSGNGIVERRVEKEEIEKEEGKANSDGDQDAKEDGNAEANVVSLGTEPKKLPKRMAMRELSKIATIKRSRGREVRISISHDGEYATAVCLAFDE